MPLFEPRLDILPPPQRHLWPELDRTPEPFTLYGGTALAFRLGHRQSMDFDFFSNEGFDPEELARRVPCLAGAETVQIAPDTLTCRVERGGGVLVSFFGNLGLGQVGPHDQARGSALRIASLVDLAGATAAVVPRRGEAKDYIDIDAAIRAGIDLATALSAARLIYGRSFNPLLTLKALSYFDDVRDLPPAVRHRLAAAVRATDPQHLPILSAVRARTDAAEPSP